MSTTASGMVLEVGATPDTSYRQALEDRGHVMTSCGGTNGGSCPLVERQGCNRAESAMGIVFRLDLDDDYNRRILNCYREDLGRDIPIQVIAKPGDEERYADDLVGTVVLTKDSDPALSDFSSRVALADMAREALSDLVGPPTRTPSAHHDEISGLSVEWQQ